MVYDDRINVAMNSTTRPFQFWFLFGDNPRTSFMWRGTTFLSKDRPYMAINLIDVSSLTWLHFDCWLSDFDSDFTYEQRAPLQRGGKHSLATCCKRQGHGIGVCQWVRRVARTWRNSSSSGSSWALWWKIQMSHQFLFIYNSSQGLLLWFEGSTQMVLDSNHLGLANAWGKKNVQLLRNFWHWLYDNVQQKVPAFPSLARGR